MLRDNVANMVKGMRLADMPDLSCNAHTHQVVINDGLNFQRLVMDVVAKLKKISNALQPLSSCTARLSLIHDEVGVPQHSVIEAMPTRWNSTLHMLQRMHEQKTAIVAYTSYHGNFTCTTTEEWEVTANLARTLTP